ncbi:MAG TPA: pseudouridine synthase [Bacilli bacterium]|nr:pseudouridine synthase [Bacilli bacterium]
MERLQKLIAESGYASRRKAEELITSGKVRVNGITVTELGTKASYEDVISVNGKKISIEPKVYFLLNKPRGVISSTSDEEGRKVVTDLINTKLSVYPVGRLDYDTTGLIILTNDGALANILMHPSNKVEKTYLVKLDKPFLIEDYYKLKAGIIVDDILTKPSRLKIKKSVKDKNFVEITIREGRNHIVKNIFKALNYDVKKLTRIKYAFLTLNGLESGQYRNLTVSEIRDLYKYKQK